MALGESIMLSASAHAQELKTTAAVFVVTLVAVKLITMANKKKYNLPPGPRGLPLLGYLPFFGKEPPITFLKLRETYGDVISINMGSWPAVVIQGRDAIKEALVTKGDDFSGRPAFTTARIVNDGRNFAFSIFGPLWKAHRKIVSNVLYNFSNSRNNPIEEMICGEAKTVVEEMLEYGDKSFCPAQHIQMAAASMVYQLCYGSHRKIRDDPDFQMVLSQTRDFNKFAGSGNPLDVMPWLRYVFPGKMSKFIDLVAQSVSRRVKKTTAAVFVFTLVAVKLITMANKKKYNLPPGPRGLPLLGYLPFFGKEPPITFLKLRETYGDVISINMGSWPAVVIQGRDAIKEALVTKGDDFAGRPAFTTARLLNEGRNFAFSLFGPLWKAHRKIVSNVLYNFSNSRNNPIEEMICGEAKTVVEEMLEYGEKSFCPAQHIQMAASSMVYQLCFGSHRQIRDDPDFQMLLSQNRDFNNFAGSGNPVDVMPWLRYVIPGKISKFVDLVAQSVSRREKKVEEHVTNYDPNNLRDIADGLLHAGDTLSSADKAVGLDKRRVVESLDTIMGAGGGTVYTALTWSMALMAKHPDIQEKIFNEIDRVVGQERDVTLADRADLPLVDATLYEVLRFSGAIPFAIPHATTCDTTLQGYDIPEGTVVMVNLYSIYTDQELWGDPHNFRPERFVTPEGDLDRALAEQVTAFSLGRRRCVGEFLARTELFMFFTTLLQRIRIYKPPGLPDYTLEGTFSLSHELLPFEVCVAPRE